jgi:anionic cell wall polymer biosynthesis LytR-Cps2A-Psr (LCP) family protein
VNDRHDGYAGDQYELIGYDANGQPVYQQVPQPPRHQQNGPGGGQHGGHHEPGPYDGYGTAPQYGTPQDPYGYGQQPAMPPQDASPPPEGHGWYSQTAQQPVIPAQEPPPQPEGHGWYPQTAQQPAVPSQAPYEPHEPAGRASDIGTRPGPPREPGPDGRSGAGDDADYRPEQFAFVEESEDSEDVIDWLKFTESRTERREEARRRARSRVIALVVVLVLALSGGVGYLWYAGKLPALPGSDSETGTAAESGPQNRDVIVIHLHNTKQGGTSTVLLVDNTTTKHGATLLLPNSLALTADDGTATTLGKSVSDDGSTGTRESMDTLLGTQIQGTWRLDTPYLENLVELVGGIDVTTDTAVPDPEAKGKKGKGTPEPLVKKGEDQTLSGAMAVAYATYRAPGEPETAQLNRFGQVMQGVLRKMSSDPQSATTTIETLQQILDPSLTDKDLGAFLAKLADLAKGGDYTTTLLPVQPDGTLSQQATDRVKEVLGGTVKPAEQGSAVRVGVKNATGAKEATESARVALVNGGYTFVDGTTAPAQVSSQISYADDKRKQDAVEVAKTLGLPTSAVKKGRTTANADVSVVLGQDYDYRRKTS